MSKDVIKGSAIFESAAATMTASAAAKVNLSGRHLEAANLFVLHCKDLELKHAKDPWPKQCWEQHQSYATAAIVLSSAALEAAINEFFSSAEDHVIRGIRMPAISNFSESTIQLLNELWHIVERSNTLEKYQVALTACQRDPLPRGDTTYQNARDLLSLRNSLIHFRPEWDNDLDDHAKLERRLNGKFPENTLAPHAITWFPSKCLGAGSGEWACRSVKQFSKEFCERLKIPQQF